MTDCTLDKIEKSLMVRMLHEQHDISELFVTHLLSRNIRYEADLVDQLFNSSEKRLARILLLLSHFGKESRAESVIPTVSQDTFGSGTCVDLRELEITVSLSTAARHC